MDFRCGDVDVSAPKKKTSITSSKKSLLFIRGLKPFLVFPYCGEHDGKNFVGGNAVPKFERERALPREHGASVIGGNAVRLRGGDERGNVRAVSRIVSGETVVKKFRRERRRIAGVQSERRGVDDERFARIVKIAKLIRREHGSFFRIVPVRNCGDECFGAVAGTVDDDELGAVLRESRRGDCARRTARAEKHDARSREPHTEPHSRRARESASVGIFSAPAAASIVAHERVCRADVLRFGRNFFQQRERGNFVRDREIDAEKVFFKKQRERFAELFGGDFETKIAAFGELGRTAFPRGGVERGVVHFRRKRMRNRFAEHGETRRRARPCAEIVERKSFFDIGHYAGKPKSERAALKANFLRAGTAHENFSGRKTLCHSAREVVISRTFSKTMPNVLEQPALIHGNASREDALSSLFRIFEAHADASALDAMKAAATERERTSSTFLGRGLALPHGRTESFDEISIAVGVSDDGIPWPDEASRAHLVLLLGVPAAMIRDYLLLMQKILRWHKDTKTLDADGRVLDAAALIAELKSVVA